MQVFPELTQGSADGWGLANRPGACHGGLHGCIGGLAWPPGWQQRFRQIPGGMAAG